MLLDEFFKTYEYNGWIGPEEDKNSLLVMCRPAKNPTVKRPNEIRRFEFFNCDYCEQNAIRQIRKDRSKYVKAKVCSRYSKCYSKHLTIATVKGKKYQGISTSREKPVINKNGYVSWTEYKLDDSGHRIKHKSGNGNVRIETFEHRVVMEEYLGRKLAKNEQVHHINCNKTDNHIDNLWICNRQTHLKAHASVNKLIGSLLELHIIRFNRKTGKYGLDIMGIQCLNTMKPYIINKPKENNNG
mgnify:CR=1 FL=1|tara:strand:- start:438 stop:1163 length:726 start_codon:yes stop_codon:yes gene_type:complete